MVCVYCGNETQVTNSRHQKRNNQVWRRRRCLKCRAVFTTIESTDYANALRVQDGSDFKPFLADLLYTEVLLALSDRKQAYIDAREVTATIIKALLQHKSSPLFSANEISQVTAGVLKRFDKQAWHRYAAEHPSV